VRRGSDLRARPVITGVGLITPLGLTRDASWAGVREGRSAIGPIERFDAATFPWPAAAEIRDFVPRKVLPDRKAIKLMSPPARLAVAAALEARRDAGHERSPDPSDGGLFIGAGYETVDLRSVLRMMGSCRPPDAAVGDADYDTIDVVRLWTEARHRMNPLDALKILPNMALAHVSIALGLQGPNSALGPHGASGLQALADAALSVATGEAPYAVAGGTDSPINLFMVAYFGVEGLLSPTGRCAPFTADADGTVPGEAAAMFWVEDAAGADARGATVYAEILGTGQAHADGPYGPPREPGVFERAARQALDDAGVAPGDVARLVADGWGVPAVDRAERTAAAALFGGADPPRRSSKHLLGHGFAAAGAVELGLALGEPAGGPELCWAAGVDGTVAALVLGRGGEGAP